MNKGLLIVSILAFSSKCSLKGICFICVAYVCIHFISVYLHLWIGSPTSSLTFVHIDPHVKSIYSCSLRTVNNSQMDTSTTSAMEASASSSTGSSVLLDTGLDLSNNSIEEANTADLSLTSPSQSVDDKEMLDTKKDQQFAWTDCSLLGYCDRNW